MLTEELSLDDIDNKEADLAKSNKPGAAEDLELTIDDYDIPAPSSRNNATDNNKPEYEVEVSINLEKSLSAEQADIVTDLLKIDSDEKLDELTLEDSDKSMSCVMDLPPEVVPRLANQHTFKTISTYRLTNDDIEHSTLNPQVGLTGQFERPSTRYRQQSVPNSREIVNRNSLPGPSSQYRQTQNLEHSRESINRENLPGPNDVRRRATSAHLNRSNTGSAARKAQRGRIIRNRPSEGSHAPNGFSRPRQASEDSKEEPEPERWFRTRVHLFGVFDKQY
jgi:hypothetical protein